MNDIEIALAILEQYIGVLTNVWTFYFIVVLGIHGFVGAVMSSDSGMNSRTKWLVTIVLFIFGFANYLAMVRVGSYIDSLQSHILAQQTNPEMLKLLSSVAYKGWAEHYGLAVYPVALLFIWYPRAKEQS